MTGIWASDVPISMPVPPEDTLVRKYGGFGVGWYGGVIHDLNQADLEDMRTADFAPPAHGITPGETSVG